MTVLWIKASNVLGLTLDHAFSARLDLFSRIAAILYFQDILGWGIVFNYRVVSS